MSEAEGMKSKASKETVPAFPTMITRKSRPMNVWIGKGTEIEGKFTKFCKAEGIQIYTVVRKVKFAFVKRTIRSSNNNLSRYVEDYGYKFLHKLTQFGHNREFWRELFYRLDTEKCHEFRFLVHFVQHTSTTIKKTQVKNWI